MTEQTNTSMFYDYSVLVVVEPEFESKVKDIEAYRNNLVKHLTKRAGGTPLRIVTPKGKFGFVGFEEMESDDRNKTAFVRSVEDYLTQLNEIVVVANYQQHPFFDALSNSATGASKTVSFYGY
ncbi:hypothetical protein PQC07_gp051 [Aeromonas phage D3]|uniref:Uncharacterized protein n=3 Tax=Ludhianavirus TaxID=3044751 RepID=A0A514A1V6_9CAUD|nr:hypothetical protein PQC06_gp138 [Aeromonas phage LAh10]YP_010668705.1 hypothetical protein PQC07_gp051 [Aeromonas phage D3]YP_010668972.1 hypothetical protein PQC08_gp051 [Aeromonas phage D6]QEP52260.1 hypothetical protein D9_0053 [Aeromonas phage D9]QDH47212.1 hypothetical protein LAh10_138 [Aeromonas phage LAh10]QDJ96954.1 hypothetical protein D3_0224 [Aeromonas phage D3]QDJ97383.1 hypothetical protein D6_0224 [Aeromonas phage D6]